MRQEILSYNKRAARECILNCYCHRDYSRKSNIKIVVLCQDFGLHKCKKLIDAN